MVDWQSAIVFLLLVLFLIWIFFGGGDYEYVGLKPLLNNQSLPKDVPVYIKDMEAKDNAPIRPNAFLSKGERICRQFVEKHYGKPFPNCRPDFLRNPETGQNLELDCYNQELGFAIEYSGQQHYVYPNGLHKNREEFIKQLRRDRFKVRCCEKNGVYLIRVPYTVRYSDIPDYIRKRLPENRYPGDGL